MIHIHWQGWLLWGTVATMVLSIMLSASQGLGLTRMNLPFVIGTMFTPDRDRAKLVGFCVHFVNGLLFSLGYVAIFAELDRAAWWIGGLIGLLHALFVLVVMMSVMPGLHPRMASEEHGPEASRILEPPGFMALNYGFQTPLTVLVSHVIFGALLGALYRLH